MNSSEGFVSLHSMANAAPEGLDVHTNQPALDDRTSGEIEESQKVDNNMDKGVDEKQHAQSTAYQARDNIKNVEPIQNQQPLETNTSVGTEPANIHSNGNASSIISQSSVDAQMETVIGHVLELGGGHQFSQSISSDDKEKALEHIQREILGCRNPMESLAEVASLQPTITAEPTEKPSSSDQTERPVTQVEPELFIAVEPKLDLKKNELTEPVEAHCTQTEQTNDVMNDKAEIDSDPTAQNTEISPEVVEEPEDDKRLEEDKEPEESLENISTFIEENPSTHINDTISSLEDSIREEILKASAKEFDSNNEQTEAQTASEELANNVDNQSAVIEETVEVIEQPMDATGAEADAEAASLAEQPAPIVEEASSGDENTKQAGEDKDTDNEVIIEKPVFEKIETQPTEDQNDGDNKDKVVDKKSVEQTPAEPEKSVRSLRTRKPKRPLELDEKDAKIEPVKKPKVKVPRVTDELNQTVGGESSQATPAVKITHKSRATISSSDPSARPLEARYEVQSNRKYKCRNCNYSTDRLNNIVFHHKPATEFTSGVRCLGLLRAAEEQRAAIIRQQQTPKGNKRKSYSRYA